MKQWKFIVHRNWINFIIPVMLLVFGFILLRVPTRADELGVSSSGYTPDQAPPQITVISPLPDSVVDTAAPLIQVSFMDTGSDIDQNSVRLLLDRMDVTAPATIERLGAAAQGAVGSYKISYHPSASLKTGIHEIDFSVQDQAGNLAEVHWSFEVKIPPQWGFRASGGYTFQIDLLSLNSVNMLDLTLQGQTRDTDVRLHLFGRAETPYEQESIYYLDTYSLGIYHQRFALVLGFTGISLESELLQNSLEKGWVASNTVDLANGQCNWVAFAGSTSNNSGLSNDLGYIFGIDKIEGVIGKWFGANGWNFSGFGLRLEGMGAGADFIDIKGNSPFGKPFLIRYEFLHGDSWGNGPDLVGNAAVVHLDNIIGASVIGLDYMIFEGDYPALGTTPIFSPGYGGVNKYTLRYFTPLPKGQSLSVDSSYAMKNLDGSLDQSIWRDTVNVGYVWNPGPALSLNFTTTNQKEYFGETNYLTNNLTHNLVINFNKTIEKSTLQSSLTLWQNCDLVNNNSSNSVTFSSAWTIPVGLPLESDQPVAPKPVGYRPIGGSNLIPTLNWTFQNQVDGNTIEVAEFRVTLDGQLAPESSRSSVSLSRKISENTQLKTFETWNGLGMNLYSKTWGNSNLTITFNYTWHTVDVAGGFSEDWTRGLSLIWKCFF